MLPEYIFFTGVPGSRWSGIAQEIKSKPGYNLTDRAPHRVYKHGDFSGHMDAYFGNGMEFVASPVKQGLYKENLDKPFQDKKGCKLLLSHEWPYYFEHILDEYPDAWIQLIYRPDQNSFDWWKQAGGFSITYPNYDWYISDSIMWERIQEQNKLILNFAEKYNISWLQHHTHSDISIGIYYGNTKC